MRYKMKVNLSFKTILIITLSAFTLINSSASATDLNSNNWIGHTYSGVDTVTGKSCSVQIDSNIDYSILGDTITIALQLDTETVKMKLTNHPFIGGNNFGRSSYILSKKMSDFGVILDYADNYWNELQIKNNGSQALFINTHHGTSRGGLIVAEPKGKLITCEMSQVK